MTTSQTLSLSEPTGSDKIPTSALVYFRARLRQRVFNAIIKEYKRSGVSQADLARRLDKEPAQISRWLSGPGNMTLDTASDILFAISGAELGAQIERPLSRKVVREDIHPSRPRNIEAIED